MSTAAIITLSIAWVYILIMVVYFFAKVVRKDAERRKKEQPNTQ